jgi:hypothetical protein
MTSFLQNWVHLVILLSACLEQLRTGIQSYWWRPRGDWRTWARGSASTLISTSLPLAYSGRKRRRPSHSQLQRQRLQAKIGRLRSARLPPERTGMPRLKHPSKPFSGLQKPKGPYQGHLSVFEKMLSIDNTWWIQYFIWNSYVFTNSVYDIDKFVLGVF